MSKSTNQVKLKELVCPVSRPVKVTADETYTSLGVKWYANGLFVKEPLSGVDIKANRLFKIESGDFIYNRLFAWKGSFALASSEHSGCFVSGEFPTFRVDESKLITAYLMCYFSNPMVWDAIAKLSSGASQTSRLRFHENDFLSWEIPLPPLPEQQRIVRILEAGDALRRIRARADTRTYNFIPALFNEMFGDPATNPKGWKRGALSAFGATIRYGLGQPPKTYDDGIPLLRATNVKRGQITIKGLVKVRAEDIPESKNAFLKADEVIVVRSGAYTGDVARVGEEWEGSVAGYDLVVNPGDKFTGTFIAFYLLTNSVQQDYFAGLKVRAAQPHLNAQQIGATPIFLPPLSLQREFAVRVAEVRNLQAQQARSRQRLEDLFQTLLHRAFSGEL